MAVTTETSALLLIRALATIKAADPANPDPVSLELENVSGGRRWSDGTGTDQVDRIYKVDGVVGAGATVSYDLLAAGALKDIFGQAIDADELKALVIRCETGEIEFRGPAANGISLFTAASEGIKLAPTHVAAFDLGSDGIEVQVSTLSKFDVFDLDGGGSTYTLWLVVAQ